jgi:hypothetical protein
MHFCYHDPDLLKATLVNGKICALNTLKTIFNKILNIVYHIFLKFTLNK